MTEAPRGSESSSAARAPESATEAQRGRRARTPHADSSSESRPLLGALGRLGLDLAGRLSPRAAYRWGGILGRWYSHWPTRSALATRVNLEIAFPERAAAERKVLLRESFAHAGRCFLEFGRIWRGRDQGLPGIVREVRGRDELDRALALGKGALMIVPHLGSWEFLGVFLAAHYSVSTLYRPPRVMQMDAVMRQGRERHGLSLAPANTRGVLSLQRALERGEIACVLPDQDPGRGAGVFVPFFGHLANTGTLVARLAAKSAAPVFTACALRGEDGRFDIVFEPAEVEVAAPDAVIGTAAVNRSIERCVRAAPDQYLWSYKRFRYQPPGRASPYGRSKRLRRRRIRAPENA